TLFFHAARAENIKKISEFHLEHENGSTLLFLPPDELLKSTVKCDLLLVDEAAALPIFILQKLLQNHSRIVFATTEHGYEGSGRGFSTKFKALLTQNAPSWKEVKLSTPIRYAAHCPVEAWLYQFCLLDAKTPPAAFGKITVAAISQQQLLASEALLRQVFALLVNAHYQTSPNDLLYLLSETPAPILLGAFVGEHLVGIVWAQAEGGLPAPLADEIAQGRRRVKGHLLAQSLAQHTGITELLSTPYWRIVRLAVLASHQQQGVARLLHDELEKLARQNVALLGVSCSAEAQLLAVWRKFCYTPVRIGVKKDQASGNYSLLFVKYLSALPSPAWLTQLTDLFFVNFHSQIAQQFTQLSCDVALPLFKDALLSHKMHESCAWQSALFASGKLGFEVTAGSIENWFCAWLNEEKDLAITPELKLAFNKIIQRHSWQEIALEHNFAGKKQALAALQGWVRSCIAKQNSSQ
ncbi:MAG: GNAT family N-acetyltransferase, partial [Vibrionaceae bacterium]